jgi:hypothetical protein
VGLQKQYCVLDHALSYMFAMLQSYGMNSASAAVVPAQQCAQQPSEDPATAAHKVLLRHCLTRRVCDACVCPGDYNATFYTQLLRGFVSGAKAGDPAVKRLPCALQVRVQVSLLTMAT